MWQSVARERSDDCHTFRLKPSMRLPELGPRLPVLELNIGELGSDADAGLYDGWLFDRSNTSWQVSYGGSACLYTDLDEGERRSTRTQSED
jgi:hypothetical protein